MDFDFNTILSTASAIAALLSALYAANSAHSAKRSADTAEREYNDTISGIQAYFVDGFSWRASNDTHLVALGCTLTNLASVASSIVRIELRLHEYNTSGASSILILLPVIADAPAGRTLEPLPNPVNLSERSTVSGWITFKIPDTFASDRTIDKYELQFTTSNGFRTSISTHLMRQIEYASLDTEE